MIVSLGGTNFQSTGEQYAFDMHPGENTCVGIVSNNSGDLVDGSLPYNILLGDIFCRVVYTVFDYEQKRLSFAYARNA